MTKRKSPFPPGPLTEPLSATATAAERMEHFYRVLKALQAHYEDGTPAGLLVRLMFDCVPALRRQNKRGRRRPAERYGELLSLYDEVRAEHRNASDTKIFAAMSRRMKRNGITKTGSIKEQIRRAKAWRNQDAMNQIAVLVDASENLGRPIKAPPLEPLEANLMQIAALLDEASRGIDEPIEAPPASVGGAKIRA